MQPGPTAYRAFQARHVFNRRHFFYQSKFKPISKRQFVTSEGIRNLNMRYVISKK
jgi:hypothetical protein